MILDIGATKYGLEPNYKLLSDIASECFIPLGYGGGIKNLKDASKIIEIGFEKICLQSGAIKDHQLIYEISKNLAHKVV